MIAAEQFIIYRTGFEYKVSIKALRVTIVVLTEPGSHRELHQTLATTLQILAQTHLKDYPGNNNSQILLMQYFQEKGWTVQNIPENNSGS